MIIEELFTFDLKEPFNSSEYFSYIYHLKYDFYRKIFKYKNDRNYDMEKDPDYIKIIKLEKEHLLNTLSTLEIDQIKFQYLSPKFGECCYTYHDHLDREVHFIDNDGDNTDWYAFYSESQRKKDIENYLRIRERKEKILKLNNLI